MRGKKSGMRPRFTGIPFFIYPVTDMARARSFYGRVLGLKETLNREDKYVEFEVGPGTIALSALLEGCVPGTSGAVALETPDFEDVIAHLRQHGVVFLFGPADLGPCHFARFLDSEGNHIAVHRTTPA
jgi:predicted enzyme related to lactoylglutathione lyase